MFNRLRSIRKRWFVLAAVALLSIGIVGGTLFVSGSPASASGSPASVIGNALQHGRGHDTDRAGHGNSGDVMARVAEILDVEQDTLESAFKTAWDEQAETRFDAKVDALVTDETLTQEQGDAAKTWFEDRPDKSGPLAIRLAGTSDTDKVDTWLEKLVDAEKLTQDEADALSAWHDDRPDSLPEHTRSRSGNRHGRHGHHGHDGDESVEE